jgi:hypothetical protein
MHKLETAEFFCLRAEEKLAVLSILCSCIYDTSRVQNLQQEHMNKREQLRNERSKKETADKRAVGMSFSETQSDSCAAQAKQLMESRRQQAIAIVRSRNTPSASDSKVQRTTSALHTLLIFSMHRHGISLITPFLLSE